MSWPYEYSEITLEKTLADITAYLNGELIGDGSVKITGFSGLQDAGTGDLSFLANKKYVPLLKRTRASAVLVSNQEDYQVRNTALILVDNPSAAFSKLLSCCVEPPLETFHGIHPTAVIAQTAVIAKDAHIGPHAVIEPEVEIGSRTRICAGAFIGFQSRIGENCLIHPNVSIGHKSIIGNRVIIHSGTVIGSDGFGYITESGVHEKIPQIGIVEIRDDVEIGANVTIDRARFDKTLIDTGTKIDNLIQIAHNVRIGKGCIIVSQAGIAGSTELGNYVVIGGQVGVAGHVTIGDGAMIAAQSGIAKSVEPGSVLFGSPAQPHMKAKRVNAAVNKLPEYLEEIRNLRKRIRDIEKKIPEIS